MKNIMAIKISKTTEINVPTELKIKKKWSKYSLLILEYLIINGRSSRSQMLQDLDLELKSIKSSIRMLIQWGIIIRQPNLFDMRSVNYFINPDKYFIIIEILGNHNLLKNYNDMTN